MFDMRMTVIFKDGRTQEAKIRPSDCVAFEEKYDIAITAAFSEETKTKLSHIYFLAYSAAGSALEFGEWLDSVDEIQVEAVGDAAPLDQAPTNGSTQRSPSKPASRRRS